MCGSHPCARPACTWSPAWLKACEARHVATLPAERRRGYYELVGKQRGAEALAELKQMATQAWKDAQNENQGNQHG